MLCMLVNRFKKLTSLLWYDVTAIKAVSSKVKLTLSSGELAATISIFATYLCIVWTRSYGKQWIAENEKVKCILCCGPLTIACFLLWRSWVIFTVLKLTGFFIHISPVAGELGCRNFILSSSCSISDTVVACHLPPMYLYLLSSAGTRWRVMLYSRVRSRPETAIISCGKKRLLWRRKKQKTNSNH